MAHVLRLSHEIVEAEPHSVNRTFPLKKQQLRIEWLSLLMSRGAPQEHSGMGTIDFFAVHWDHYYSLIVMKSFAEQIAVVMDTA